MGQFTNFSEEFLAQYNSKDIPWGFNGMGYIVYKRTYARVIEGENRTEEWKETIVRAIKGAQAIGAGYTQEEAERMFDHLFNLRGTFSGRALWQLGTKMAVNYGDSMCNCWTVSIRRPKDFLFIFDELMLGGKAA